MVAGSCIKIVSFQFGHSNQNGDYSLRTYIIESVRLIHSTMLVIFLATKYINGIVHIEDFIN